VTGPVAPRASEFAALSPRNRLAGAALFLASDLSSAITGETLYLDCGYKIMGF
jgi:enoyl-[acyl-carrier-protein] reductase (NADH)